MQPRSKWWIITIIALFVLSFLYAFQPLRLKPKEGLAVQSTFRYTFAQPLVQDEAEISGKAAEIQSYLVAQGLELDRVEFKEKNVLEVETLALDEAQATADRQKLLAALAKKYPGVTAMALPDEQQQEEPISTFGPFALYRPTSQIKLGLDLLGGAHVVLRAMPETTLTFTSPETKPMVQVATATPEAGAPAPAAAGGLTPQQLSERVRDVLVRAGAKAEDLSVSVPAGNLVQVRTRAETPEIATRQQKLVGDFLTRQFPGTTVTPETPESVFIETETAEKVQNVIDRRLYQMSDIREPVIQTQGKDRLIVELPGVNDPERVVQILKSTAMLEFRLIPQRYTAIGAEQDDYSEWRDSQTGQTVPWERVAAESKAEFTGRDLMSTATVQPNDTGQWVVNFELKTDRKQAFREFTRRNIGRLMAIVLDNEVQMAPVIKSEIPGAGIIEGNFTAQDARDLKLLLNAGALPVPLEIAENRTISATLGAYAIQRALLAGFVGLAAIALFMLLMYRLPGALACLALGLYILMTLAVLVFTKTVVTLPGIAGIILSIGMAVDANILAFERLKEEVWSGKAIRSSIDAGFERAWTAILDSNVNSLIVAAVLYFLGSSSIKSFAVTLFLGVVVSLFTSVTVSRWMLTMAGQSRLGRNLALFAVRNAE
ncbi:MAG: protein translocase subunit SecD [Armatimonadota bacterium]